MTATLGRSLLRFLAGLLLSLGALWLATPVWIAPLARAVLAQADVELLALTAARPLIGGWRVERLALGRGGQTLELRGATLRWRLPADLRLLRIEHLTARLGTEEGGTATASTAPPPDPAALLGALPVAHIELLAAEIDLPAPGAHFAGSLEASRTRARVDGRITSRSLPGVLSVRGRYRVGEGLALRVADGAGTELLGADLSLAFAAGRLESAGRVTLAAPLLPALAADAPTVAGTLMLATRLAADDAVLDVLPGTALEIVGATPAFSATIAPDGPWTLALHEGRLASTGALSAEVSGTTPPGGTAPAADLSGRLRLTSLAGTLDALDFAFDGHFDLAAGSRRASGDLELRAALQDGSILAVEAASGLRRVRLEDAAADLRLENLDVELEVGTHLELATQRLRAARFAAGAEALQLAGRRVDLSALRARAEVAGSADAARARLELSGAGVHVQASAALTGGAAEFEILEARAELGPASLPGAVIAALVPAVDLRTGRIEVAAARWPPAPSTPLGAHVTGLGLATPELTLEGLDARLALTLQARTASFSVEEGRIASLASPAADAVRAEQVRFRLRGEVLDWGLAALDTGRAPGGLRAETVELRSDHLVADTARIDALLVTGSAEVGTDGFAADLDVSAPTLTVTVPASALHCTLALRDETLGLRDCGLTLLGGSVEVPAATIELDSLDGYLPVALRGLDLGAVLLLMQDEALMGEGVLDGAVPLRLSEGVPTIHDGYVGARPPGGRLRYAADAALLQRLSQPGLSLAMAALGDFRYRELGAFVDYESDGTLGLRVRLAGASPRVENGRPIDFNLTVTQSLPLLLQSLRLSQTIGDAIERRLEERTAPR